MRISFLKSLLLVISGLFLHQPAFAAAHGAETTDDEIDTEVFEAYGWMIGRQTGLQAGYSEKEIEHILIGMRRSADEDYEPENFQELLPRMQAVVEQRITAYNARLEATESAEAAQQEQSVEEFFAELDRDPDIYSTPTGLRYEKLSEGLGPRPIPADTVRVHYHGTLIDGTVFDSSRERGEPAEFPMQGVIPGFREGLELVNKGGTIRLYIPPELGYGNRRAGQIPPGSPLIFEVELIEINPGQ